MSLVVTISGNVGSIGDVQTSKKGNQFIILSVCHKDETDTSPAQWMRVAVVGLDNIAHVQKTVPVGALVEITGTPYLDTAYDKATKQVRPVMSAYMNHIEIKALPKAKAADEALPSIPTPEQLNNPQPPVVEGKPATRKRKAKKEQAEPVAEGGTPI